MANGRGRGSRTTNAHLSNRRKRALAMERRYRANETLAVEKIMQDRSTGSNINIPQRANNGTLAIEKIMQDRSTESNRPQTKCEDDQLKRNTTSLAHHYFSPPRKMVDTSNPIYFIHMGKAGGTSIDRLFLSRNKKQMRNGTLERPATPFTQHLNDMKKVYIGDSHFDWSYIQELQQMRAWNKKHSERFSIQELKNVVKNQAPAFYRESGYDDLYREDFDVLNNADVITFLRHPVSRAVSQFHYSKALPWAKKDNMTFMHQSFEEYLDDPNKTWTQPIADGESGVDFLAGIFETEAGSWIETDHRETQLKRHLRQNKTAACLFAAQRLENTTWFGIMEDIERSMKLLQITLGLKEVPILAQANAQRGQNKSLPSKEMVEKIRKYVPKDLWLYEYAQRLFESRWEYFMGGGCTYVPPELPPLPDFEQ